MLEPIYLDLHIHTSENADGLNINYDVAKLVEKILDYNGNSKSLISLTDHNTINKKEFNIIMGIFSLLALHEVILYISLYFRIPPMKFFVVPIIFIVSAYIFVYKMLYQANSIKTK